VASCRRGRFQWSVNLLEPLACGKAAILTSWDICDSIEVMRYRLRTLLMVATLSITSCGPEITRNNSSLINDLSGVWTYAIESGSSDLRIPDSTSVFVVNGMNYKIYHYAHGRYSLSRYGEVVGQEGVYFMQNEASFYSPHFFVENDGQKILIFNKFDYDKYIKTGQINVVTLIRTADKLDFSRPPPRASIQQVGLPFYDDYPELRKPNPN
jgi:hypothetical protein